MPAVVSNHPLTPSNITRWVAALTSRGAHHGVGRHAGGGHGDIFSALTGLVQEGLLLGLDGGVDVDRGVVGLGLGDIAAAGGGGGAERGAGEGGRRVSPRGNAEGLPRDCGCEAGHVGDGRAM